MTRKRKMIMYGTVVLMVLTLTGQKKGIYQLPVSAEKWESAVESENPETGDHPSPLIAGMALAFSGVALCILADENSRKK